MQEWVAESSPYLWEFCGFKTTSFNFDLGNKMQLSIDPSTKRERRILFSFSWGKHCRSQNLARMIGLLYYIMSKIHNLHIHNVLYQKRKNGITQDRMPKQNKNFFYRKFLIWNASNIRQKFWLHSKVLCRGV